MWYQLQAYDTCHQCCDVSHKVVTPTVPRLLHQPQGLTPVQKLWHLHHPDTCPKVVTPVSRLWHWPLRLTISMSCNTNLMIATWHLVVTVVLTVSRPWTQPNPWHWWPHWAWQLFVGIPCFLNKLYLPDLNNNWWTILNAFIDLVNKWQNFLPSV